MKENRKELILFYYRDDCIWNMYHKNIDRKMIVFGFISNSLLIAMYLSYDLNCSEDNLIKEIKIISRVSGNYTNINQKTKLQYFTLIFFFLFF